MRKVSIPALDSEAFPRATDRNIESAANAAYSAAANGWEYVGPYRGSDAKTDARCLLCGWTGERFPSHNRGRKDREGNWRPHSRTRHFGAECIPQEEQADALAKLRAEFGISAPGSERN